MKNSNLTSIILSIATLFCFSGYHNGSGFIVIERNKMISKTEVSNQEYEEFLTNIQGFSNLNTKIYSNEWMNLSPYKSYYEGFKDFYFLQNKNHPVVNISQSGAIAFCKWKTKQYNNKLQREFKKVIFRLPTEKEWLSTLKKYNTQIDQFQSFYRVKMVEPDSMMKANNWKVPDIQTSDLFDSDSKYAEMIEYLLSNRHKDKFLLCRTDYPVIKENFPIHMQSNVSEWLSEKDMAIGANWFDFQSDTLNKSEHSFKVNFPSPKIGFRVLIEVIEK